MAQWQVSLAWEKKSQGQFLATGNTWHERLLCKTLEKHHHSESTKGTHFKCPLFIYCVACYAVAMASISGWHFKGCPSLAESCIWAKWLAFWKMKWWLKRGYSRQAQKLIYIYFLSLAVFKIGMPKSWKNLIKTLSQLSSTHTCTFHLRTSFGYLPWAQNKL